MLQVVPASSGQCSLERTRPLVVSLGQSPHLVRGQAKISKNRPERLASVDGVQEPLPHLYREPVFVPPLARMPFQCRFALAGTTDSRNRVTTLLVSRAEPEAKVEALRRG
jgi:hypothetical protein